MRYVAFSCLLALCCAWLVFDLLFAPLEGGGERVEIPRYCGAAVHDAAFADWMEVEITYRHDDSPAGTVLSQSPEGGSFRKLTERFPTCRLQLTVSLGKEGVRLPSLIGTDVRDAEARLRALGLAVRIEKRPSPYPEGTVYEMEPVGGEIPKGEEVRLLVSAGEPQASVKVPDLKGLTRVQALVLLWRSQLSVGEVVEELSLREPSGTVLRQSHVAGTLVAAGTKITIYVAREAGT